MRRPLLDRGHDFPLWIKCWPVGHKSFLVQIANSCLATTREEKRKGLEKQHPTPQDIKHAFRIKESLLRVKGGA